MKDFKIGDLVKPSEGYAIENKHTANQCDIGLVVSYRRLKGRLLYRVFWWPSQTYFSFEAIGLELMSRVTLHKPRIPRPMKAKKTTKPKAKAEVRRGNAKG